MAADLPYILADPVWVDGIPYPDIIKEETLREIPNTPVYEDDIYIASYLKSGTFWLATTVEAILRSDDLETFVQKGPQFNRIMEVFRNYQKFLSSARPRITLTHLRFGQLPTGIAQGKGKVIHISRNPRDVAVSNYHFSQIFRPLGYFSGSWDTFFQSFMAGRVSRGPWYDHMIDWMNHKDQPNVLFIQYEDLIDNLHGKINQIAAFLEKSLDKQKCNQIAEIVSFDSMKNHHQLNATLPECKGNFLRKGVVGDWVNYFTPEQEQRMDEMYQKLRAETGVNFRFK